jgi:hypothetical protein
MHTALLSTGAHLAGFDPLGAAADASVRRKIASKELRPIHAHQAPAAAVPGVASTNAAAAVTAAGAS